MASALTHLAWTALLGRALPLPPLPRRVRLGALGCACLADADFLLAPLCEGPSDLLAHRGLAHAPALSAAVAVAGALLLTPRAGFRRQLPTVALLFFLAGLGHALLDLLTWGGPGLALLAPLSPERWLAPPWLRLAPVVPLGLDEYLGTLGALALLNELLFILLPTWLGLRLLELRAEDPADRRAVRARLGLLALAWVAAATTLRTAAPHAFRPPAARLIAGFHPDAEDGPERIPTTGLPGGALLTRFDALRELGLFDRELRPAAAAWSSGFFPFWFGGHAGRWSDPVPALLVRTLTGADVEPSARIARWLEAARAGDGDARSRLFRLAPTEKYDLARADPTFAVTRETLALTHNRRPLPRFWFGLCNGVAAAALAAPEPFRTVDVVNRDGHPVRFHPNDVKALLAAAHFLPTDVVELGLVCRDRGFDPGARCSLHPASLALAALNRLGLARESFLIEVHASRQAQYYPVAAATVRLVRAPYELGEAPLAPELEGRAARLVDLVVELELSSTLAPVAAADTPDGEKDGTWYRRVGTRPLRVSYPMTLALDGAGELIGGRYTGDPADGPDQLQFVSKTPAVSDDGTIAAYPGLRWAALARLAEASVSTAPEPPRVDARLFEDPPAVATPSE